MSLRLDRQSKAVSVQERTITGANLQFDQLAREQVTPDPKPVSVKKPAKRLKRIAGFRRNPTLAAQFRFAVLHEFGGRCVMADYDGRTDADADTAASTEGGPHGLRAAHAASSVPSPGGSADLLRDVPGGVRPNGSQARHVCDGPLDPAHILPKQTLRRLGLSEQVVYDDRDGMALCRRHHRRSDDGLERVPRELLPPSVFEFARDHNLTHVLDKLYERSTG